MPTGVYDHRGKNGFQKGHPIYPGSEKGWIKKGQKLSPEHRRNISLALIGNTRTRGKKHTLDWRVAMSERQRGSGHWNWQGGRTPLSLKDRRGVSYKVWRLQVFERDDYRCFDCGERGGDLEAHHIYPFALFPRLRFAIENGITLCRQCHRKRPKPITPNRK